MSRESSGGSWRVLSCLVIVMVLVSGCGGASSNATPPAGTGSAPKSFGTAAPPQLVGTPQGSGNAPALAVQGQAALEAGKLQEAEKTFRDAVNLDSQSADAQFGLGNVYIRQGQLAAAETAYRAAIAIDPNMDSAHLNLGVVYYQMEQFGKAEEEFNTVLRLSPNDAQALYLLAAVRIQTKQYTEAEKLLNQAKQANPNLAEVYFGLGALYKIQGKNQEAIAAFEKFLSLGTAQDPTAEDAARAELKALRGE